MFIAEQWADRESTQTTHCTERSPCCNVVGVWVGRPQLENYTMIHYDTLWFIMIRYCFITILYNYAKINCWYYSICYGFHIWHLAQLIWLLSNISATHIVYKMGKKCSLQCHELKEKAMTTQWYPRSPWRLLVCFGFAMLLGCGWSGHSWKTSL